ncbi:hypothetical protein ACN28S_37540 [Cystobacter fuscus]
MAFILGRHDLGVGQNGVVKPGHDRVTYMGGIVGTAAKIAEEQFFHQHVVPLIAEKEENGSEVAEVFGSGTLIRIGPKRLIVTAGHVISAMVTATKMGMSLGVPLERTGVRNNTSGIVSLDGAVHGVLAPELDVGFFDLSGKVTEQIDERRFLDLASISTRSLGADDRYMVFGFPSQRGQYESGVLHYKAAFTHEDGPYTGPEPVLGVTAIKSTPNCTSELLGRAARTLRASVEHPFGSDSEWMVASGIRPVNSRSLRWRRIRSLVVGSGVPSGTSLPKRSYSNSPISKRSSLGIWEHKRRDGH